MGRAAELVNAGSGERDPSAAVVERLFEVTPLLFTAPNARVPRFRLSRCGARIARHDRSRREQDRDELQDLRRDNAQRKTIKHRTLPCGQALAFLRSLVTVVDCLSLRVAQTHTLARRELNLRRGRSDERRASEEPFLRRGLSLKSSARSENPFAAMGNAQANARPPPR